MTASLSRGVCRSHLRCTLRGTVSIVGWHILWSSTRSTHRRLRFHHPWPHRRILCKILRENPVTQLWIRTRRKTKSGQRACIHTSYMYKKVFENISMVHIVYALAKPQAVCFLECLFNVVIAVVGTFPPSFVRIQRNTTPWSGGKLEWLKCWNWFYGFP